MYILSGNEQFSDRSHDPTLITNTVVCFLWQGNRNYESLNQYFGEMGIGGNFFGEKIINNLVQPRLNLPRYV